MNKKCEKLVWKTPTMDLKICRVCCQNEGTLPIFMGDGDSMISSKLMYICLKIVVLEDDGLPSHICGACDEELTRCHQFVLKCEASDYSLRTLNQINCPTTRTLYEYKPNKIFIKEEISPPELFDGAQDGVDSNYDAALEETKVFDVLPEYSISQVKTELVPKNKSKAPLMCATCGCLVQTSLKLFRHMRTHENLRPYSCNHCDKTYKDNNSLKNHCKRNHDANRKRKYTCEYCSNMFYNKSDMITHVRMHTRETPFSCEVCPKRFTQFSALNRHKKVHTDEKPFTCSICSKSFRGKEQLKIHLTVHTDEKKHTCHVCFMDFKYKNNMRKHILRHTNRKHFVCNHCGKGFNTKGNLNMHEQRIHSEKSGHCSICNKSFPNMEIHLRRHTGERPLQCVLCPRVFAEANALSHHVNFRHKNTDKYRCLHEGCTEMFPSQAMLEFHEAKYHGTSFPYLCEICSRGFFRKNDLGRHKISMHKER